MSSSQRVVVPCTACGKLNRVDLARATGAAEARAVCANCRAPLVLDAPLVLTESNFDVVVNGSAIPVLIDFYADWCGPCKMMAPVFADFARRHAGEVLVAKVDTDRNPSLSMRFGIRSIPTLTLMKNGQEAARQVGAVPMAALEQLIAAR